MEVVEQQTNSEFAPPPFRVDVSLHEVLKSGERPHAVQPQAEPQKLPTPVYPQLPEDYTFERSGFKYHWHNGLRAFRRWMVPYMQSRVKANEFRPLLSYLFSEWKCNLDCHYCWAFNNSVKGMTEDVARRSIDWLHATGCRVIAIMGGEPLLRPDFIHKVVYYGTKKDFFVYLPTNGRLMRPEVIDKVGDAGVAAINLAIDAIDEKPGLPKALNKIRPYFDYLVKQQRRYGYMVVFNTNICRHNIEDVKLITEIGHDHGISTDVHINEPPMIEQTHFKHLDENATYIRPEDWPKVDALLDWLTEKNLSGYIMVNSAKHLQEMKDFMRGKVERWNCRAGWNSCVIRTDGTLAPCFPMYSANYDWGTIEKPKFEFNQLRAMKQGCMKHCLSTCQYVLGYYYNNAHVLGWMTKQALHGFKGLTDIMEGRGPSTHA